MQWTVQVAMVLLNIAWVLFFLQPHPFSVSVQRRSTDNIKEFCIKLPSDQNWTSTPHSVNITANETSNTNITFQGQSSSILQIDHKFINFLLSDINLVSVTPQCKPNVILTFANKEVCIHVENFIPAITPLIVVLSSSNANGPDECCFKFYPRRVNKKLISSYYMTDYCCPWTGVILMTKKGRHICADPNLTWVQSIMKTLDKALL
ncbi:uncharacterized protein LOC128384375 [Scomber japonicus]|uniref:uncharacterized protein LOC128384375 n=1 Tax=Scomber japonicus TaxID=13676 RepID=UPI00230615F8|nr:uncharacterized protein LOC128384375 [Scomber japonicus]